MAQSLIKCLFIQKFDAFAISEMTFCLLESFLMIVDLCVVFFFKS